MKRILLVLSLCGCLLLSGCAIKTSAEELYCLPQLPAEYNELQAALQKVMDNGTETASPSSGSNIQPVQMVDLDGDGEDEALAFYRRSEDEKPLKIYIFSQTDDGYAETAVIEGSGTSINSITYSDMDQDGYTELIVGWKVSTEIQALSVYTLRSGKPEELMNASYVKYSQADLNRDGMQEIVIFHADLNSGAGVAEYYSWTDGMLASQSVVAISTTMAALSDKGRVKSGTLDSGEPALFVTGVTSDSEGISTSVTDVLTVRGQELSNITLSDVTGVSSLVSRFLNLYPTDINSDGIMEIPIPVELPAAEADTMPVFRVDWNRCDSDGNGTWTLSTYHSVDDGWYLILPSAWLDQLSVTRTQNGTDETVVTFSLRNGNGQVFDFLKIYSISGTGSEYRVRGNRFVLIRRAQIIYAAEFLGDDPEQAAGMTKDELRANFNLIANEWLPNE